MDIPVVMTICVKSCMNTSDSLFISIYLLVYIHDYLLMNEHIYIYKYIYTYLLMNEHFSNQK
jgi:hypothetical protein